MLRNRPGWPTLCILFCFLQRWATLCFAFSNFIVTKTALGWVVYFRLAPVDFKNWRGAHPYQAEATRSVGLRSRPRCLCLRNVQPRAHRRM